MLQKNLSSAIYINVGCILINVSRNNWSERALKSVSELSCAAVVLSRLFRLCG